MTPYNKPSTRDLDSAAPSGETGTDTAVCRCGSGPHPSNPQRCAGGHLVAGNQAATITGSRSALFWKEHRAARREIREAVIRDAGEDPADAPVALIRAADSVAQAALIQASAYERMAEAGGPLSAQGRARRSFQVWVRSTDRLERHLRLVGLDRVPRPGPSLRDVMSPNGSGE